MKLFSRRAALPGALGAGVALTLLVGGALSPLPSAQATTSAAVAQVRARPDVPLIFGHRGASGYRPEHTLASYDLAVRQGADVIEPDLVSTKDHQLVARHENDITSTTDVATRPEFASRKTTKVVDGVTLMDRWFTEDFTLAELETLRAKERLPDVRQENTIFDGRYQVPTLQQVIDLAKRESELTGRHIGIAPETKHPTYFDSLGLSLEEPLVATLRANGLDTRTSGVYVQSFETANLRELRQVFHVKVHLVQLTLSDPNAVPYDQAESSNPQTYGQLTQNAGLRQIARYADWLGPDKSQVFPRDAAGASGAASTLVERAHRAGLSVVPYTVRPENQFLPLQYRFGTDPNAYGNVLAEYLDLFRAGVDGLFSDTPDLEYAAREDFLGFTYSVEHPQAAAPPVAPAAPAQLRPAA